MSFVPFNHRPSLVGYAISYNVPVGKYARIIPANRSSSELVINGSTVFYPNYFVDDFTLPAVGGGTYTINFPAYGRWLARVYRTSNGPKPLTDATIRTHSSFALDNHYDDLILTADNYSIKEFTAYASDVLTFTAVVAGGGNTNYQVAAYRADILSVPDFWVTSGNTVTGQFYREEYSIS